LIGRFLFYQNKPDEVEVWPGKEKSKEKIRGNKMLRIAKSLLTILAVAVVAVGATGAYFSDTEVVASNTFATGTLDLKLLPGWLSSSAPLTG
jgi:predicted ribosomally synthesized peptide with SipW-like signal peptide